MVLGGLCAWLLDHLVLGFLGWEHLRLLCFALLIPGLVAALRKFFRVCVPLLSQRWDDCLAAIPTNCAALGSALLITQRGYGPAHRPGLHPVRRHRRHPGGGQLRQPPERGGPGPLPPGPSGASPSS